MADSRDARDAAFAGRRTDGSRMRRPLSPHLQVYKLGLTGNMSIAHRFTGIAWVGGLLLLVWWLAAAAAGPGPFAAVQWFLGSWLGLLGLFGLTALAWYHTLNGVRHLAWDAGYGFALPTTVRSGQAVLAGTVGLTVLTWIIGLIAW